MALKVRYTTIDGEIVSENRASVERDYVPDPLGSTVALLNSAQTKTDTVSYWPYGEVKTRTGATTTPFQFVGTKGYYRDSSTKTYVRARYLDTQKGRWLTQDPIGFGGDDRTLYSYGLCAPTNWLDPSGLQIGAIIRPFCRLGSRIGNPVGRIQPSQISEPIMRYINNPKWLRSPGRDPIRIGKPYYPITWDAPDDPCEYAYEVCEDWCDAHFKYAYGACRRKNPGPGGIAICKQYAMRWRVCCYEWCQRTKALCLGGYMAGNFPIWGCDNFGQQPPWEDPALWA